MKVQALFVICACALFSSRVAAMFDDNEAAGGDISFKVHYSSVVYSDLDSPYGVSLFIDFYTHDFLSFGLASYFHASKDHAGDYARYQLVNAIYARFYFKPFFIRSSVFKMGPNLGIGLAHEWRERGDPLRSPDIFAGVGMVIHFARNVGVTGAFQFHNMALDRERLQMISNIGVYVNIPILPGKKGGALPPRAVRP
ncbi:MAG: hypothetical protein E4G96_05555 [Chrysiogenales bacterium]|nr:MAG: hypothetical protein E4G96_05555 [Chrysiogenales bacterium]